MPKAKCYKAVLTVRHIEFPEDPLKFYHASRFGPKAEFRAALPALRRRTQATLAPWGDRFSFEFEAVAA